MERLDGVLRTVSGLLDDLRPFGVAAVGCARPGVTDAVERMDVVDVPVMVRVRGGLDGFSSVVLGLVVDMSDGRLALPTTEAERLPTDLELIEVTL